MKIINSFTQIVKEEIVAKTHSSNQLLSIISGFTRINGSLIIREHNELVTLKIENSKIAKFIYSSFQKLFNEKPKIEFLKKNQLSKNTCYVITIKNKALINKMHIHLLDNKIDQFFMQDSSLINGYIIGSFLASGSVNSPLTSNYHLEITFNDLEYANAFVSLVAYNLDVYFTMRIAKRRDKYLVYIKRADQIIDFLVLLGAENAALYFVDTTADRDLSNNANRLKNLDTANYQKTAKAASKDIKIINQLIKTNGLSSLGSEKAIMLATLRIKYPDDTLEDLAAKLSKELGKPISKSNINHLLRAFRVEGKNL